ncbi:MAG: hypothetical protein WBB01_06755 [Phormidesmis sp.]
MATQKKEKIAQETLLTEPVQAALAAETPARRSSASAKKASAKATPKATAVKKERARKAQTSAQTAKTSPSQDPQPVVPPEFQTARPAESAQAPLTLADTPASERPSEHPSELLANTGGVSFLAADCITEDIWVPNTAVPSLDEATYRSRKTQAEAQRRAIEVASLNLKNINDLHRLESQSIDIAISAKTNETQYAKLTGADIDYQTELEVNGEKSQQLMQASAKHESAARDTGYAEQLIALKDQNFELDIQQAQAVFSEKASRYRAQLAGQ